MLEITRQIRAFGIDLPGAVVELEIKLFRGIVDVYVHLYVSKEAMEEDVNNRFRLAEIRQRYRFDYDRSRDGVDLVQFVHNRIKDDLTTDRIRREKYVDEKGEVKERDVVYKEKFVDARDVKVSLSSAIGGIKK